ncbi:MAG TPA: hypothetical protein VKC60_17220 [Opitutaceae bacterium]|nr:hypothetical protein [Opitutaceae bacterium]
MKYAMMSLFFVLTSLVRGEEPYAVYLKSTRVADALPDAFYERIYDPFQFRTTNRTPIVDKEGEKIAPALKLEDIAVLLGKRGVQGVVYPEREAGSAVIIGDTLFRIGDELVFPIDDKVKPLTPQARIFLRRIRKQSLDLEVQPTTGPNQTVVYSLSTFWHR